ncbi:MAG: hypothetical protein PVG13_05475 [Thiohalophilus sp.]|jgi:hypothetical protein
MKGMLIIAMLMLATLARAGDVEIVQVELYQQSPDWRASVTLRHADTGWDHYADGWQVVTPDGKVLGHRTLYHPHVDEQPFTRSLSGINIPQGLNQVIVEAHDKVHGWSPQRVTIDLTRDSGERYRIVRR